MWKLVLLSLAALLAASPVWSQSIVVDGDIETGAQLVSNAPEGTAPLSVSSTTVVNGLNADQIDGLDSADLALEADLQNAEEMLVTLQSQIDDLGIARLRRSGQATCYSQNGNVLNCNAGAGPGQDGALQLGVNWPNPRFTENGDGTVTDNLTGLVWLEDANCENGRLDWVDALAFARTLFDGSTDHNGGDCGLSDGSVAGEWRLPNPVEIQSLFHYDVSFPAVPNTAGTGQWTEGNPFTDVKNDFYWTSATFVESASIGWLSNLSYGSIRYGSKLGSWRVWPVKGGQ